MRRYGLQYVALRYFNVAGGDPQGPHRPVHAARHASDQGRLPGSTWPARPSSRSLAPIIDTPDGTCLRDYIHVSDLIAAHVDALTHLRSGGESGIFNCGYGKGYSVLEVIKAVERVNGAALPVTYGPRRAGDPAAIVAGADRVRQVLGWQPEAREPRFHRRDRAELGAQARPAQRRLRFRAHCPIEAAFGGSMASLIEFRSPRLDRVEGMP